MFYFFAKLGRKPWAKQILPALLGVSCYGYLGCRLMGSKLFKNFSRCEDESGDLVEINPELKKLIDEVEPLAKQQMAAWKPSESFWKKDEIVTKESDWFVTSFRDPIVLGAPLGRATTSFGLPRNFTYDTREDIPEPTIVDPLVPSEGINFKKELVSQELSEAYKDAFLMSDEAKKFAIAKTVLRSDPDYVMVMTMAMALGLAMPLAIVRIGIRRLKLEHVHLNQRLPSYLLFTLLAYLEVDVLRNLINSYIDKTSDEKAIDLGFKQGAIDYYSKYIEQNKILKRIFGDKINIKDDGDLPWKFPEFATRNLMTKLEEAKQAK